MARIIYIHGFLSSSHSKKAQSTRAWIEQNRSDIVYECPDLSSYPKLAIDSLNLVLKQEPAENNYLIGSSLGGFWAAHFLEIGLAKKAVLINPAVSPHLRFADLVGQQLKHYYSDEHYCLSNEDIALLARCEGKLVANSDRFWLMVQTGDDVLDYRLATSRYRECKQTIEQGGDHSFENYERWLPEIIEFFGI